MNAGMAKWIRAALRTAAALAVGAVTWWAVMGLGFVILRASWPAYLAAEPDKAYSLAMLFARLGIFSSTIFISAAAGALAARDVRLAWLAGALILLLSILPHLYPGTVWNDYPVWYHLLYLASILPIAVVGGWAASRSHWLAPSATTPERVALEEAMRSDPKLHSATIPLPGAFVVASLAAVVSTFLIMAVWPIAAALILVIYPFVGISLLRRDTRRTE